MALWKWIKGRLNVTTDGNKWRLIYGLDNDSDEFVSPERALKLSTWWACTRLITETIATLPAAMYQKSAGDRVALQGHALQELLQYRPNADQTAVEFWEGRVAPLCSDGNSYAEKSFIGDRLVALQPLKVDNVSPIRRPSDNRLIYRVIDRGKSEDIAADKIFHIKGFAPNDEDQGLSPVAYAARSIGAAIAAERASARLFTKGMRASGFWKPPADMDETQRDQFYKNYLKPMEGLEGQGKAIVVPPGFDWGTMNITPRDAELIMARGFSVQDVCRWMGVPPILVGHSSEGQTMWGSGVEQIILGWLVLGLRAYLKRIEAAVNTRLVTRQEHARGVFFEFNFEGLLRADSAGRAALMATLAQNGLKTRNELRKLSNDPAMPGGDDLTVQSNLVPLDQLGAQQQTANTVRTALKDWLSDEKDHERKAA